MKNLANPETKIFTYAVNNNADFKAENIKVTADSTFFNVDNFKFMIPLVGRHNVLNALAAIAAATSQGLSFEQIQQGFSNLAKTKMRFEVTKKGGLTIINDAYNASPASMRAAFQTVSDIYTGRKIAVLGDMLELGDFSEQLHREVGAELVKNNFDILIAVGELGKFIAEGAKDAGLKNIFTAQTHAEAADKILQVAHDGDIILFKASVQ